MRVGNLIYLMHFCFCTGWDVKKSGAERVSVHTTTKQEAVDRGREISRNQGSEFVIHGKDEQIQQ